MTREARPTDASGSQSLSSAHLACWISEYARMHGDKTYAFSIDQDKALSYRDLATATSRLGAFLAARGIGTNDRVALLSDNSIEHLIVYLGVMAYGATICTIHLEANSAHLDNILATLDPRLILYEDGHGFETRAKTDLDRRSAPGPWQRLGRWHPTDGDGLFAELKSYPADHKWAGLGKGDDVACICFTSGTSAAPKGVMLSFDELLSNAEPTADAFGMTVQDRILDYRSFNWASAQILAGLAPLTKGATVVFARKFSQSRFFDWINGHDATIATGNPTVINILMTGDADIASANVPSLRFMTSSSAPLLTEEWRRFEERFGIPVIQGYGSSETGWIAGASEDEARFGSVGKPLPYLRVQITGSDGNALAPGEIGLIEITGNPKRDYRYLDEHGEARVNASGRIRTGDFGYLDDDGYLFVTGRQKDLIIRGGVNISPLEIDSVVMEMDTVAEVASVGIPDPIYGQVVATFVVPAENGELSEDDLRSHCASRLPAFKVPQEFHFRDSLPKTDRGKMNRKALTDDWQMLARG